ncbi:MAG: hypothetical protein ACJAXE_003095 [Neolewinella sp.]|jgi:hypothetical protein
MIKRSSMADVMAASFWGAAAGTVEESLQAKRVSRSRTVMMNLSIEIGIFANITALTSGRVLEGCFA